MLSPFPPSPPGSPRSRRPLPAREEPPTPPLCANGERPPAVPAAARGYGAAPAPGGARGGTAGTGCSQPPPAPGCPTRREAPHPPPPRALPNPQLRAALARAGTALDRYWERWDSCEPIGGSGACSPRRALSCGPGEVFKGTFVKIARLLHRVRFCSMVDGMGLQQEHKQPLCTALSLGHLSLHHPSQLIRQPPPIPSEGATAPEPHSDGGIGGHGQLLLCIANPWAWVSPSPPCWPKCCPARCFGVKRGHLGWDPGGGHISGVTAQAMEQSSCPCTRKRRPQSQLLPRQSDIPAGFPAFLHLSINWQSLGLFRNTAGSRW